MAQRIRDLVKGELTLDYFVQRSAAGWKVASIEWVRDAPSETAVPVQVSEGSATTAPVPYGLQIAKDGQYLEENPLEATVLMLILEQIVKEKRISEIAIQLNHEGHRTREGKLWSPTAVFNLLPRLIEAGPSILKNRDWSARRAEAGKPN
jgi:Recombinase